MSKKYTPLDSVINNNSTIKRNSNSNLSFSGPNLSTLSDNKKEDEFRSCSISCDYTSRASSFNALFGMDGRLGPFDHKSIQNNKFTINVDVPKFKKIKELNNNQYLSKCTVQTLCRKSINILKKLIKEQKLDFTITKKNKYIIKCRLFSNDSIEFEIRLYQLQNINENENKSLLEIIRTTNGDFGYFQFEDIFLNKCQQENIIILDRKSSDSFGLSSLSSMTSLTFDDIDEDNISLEDITDDENTFSLIGNDKEYDKKLCESIIETLSSSKSYREEYIHDAYQFSKFLSINDERQSNMLEYILENEKSNLIEKILSPIIIGKIYDAFIILHVLESIYNLFKLKNIKSQLTIPKNFVKNIQLLEDIWSNEDGVTNKLGPISINFIKSQQIQNTCQSILQLC